MPEYQNWMIVGSSCPAGHTMGQGHDSHKECEYCPEMLYRMCGALYSAPCDTDLREPRAARKEAP